MTWQPYPTVPDAERDSLYLSYCAKQRSQIEESRRDRAEEKRLIRLGAPRHYRRGLGGVLHRFWCASCCDELEAAKTATGMVHPFRPGDR
jgi:hypothetical protein